jgi:putative DNA primase/helicase
MTPLNVTAEQFLSTLFEANDTVCLHIFSDRKDEDAAFKGLKLETEAAKIDKMRETLEKHNAHNRGIFFCVNFGGHNDGDISRINAQFVESDEGTFEEQWERVNAFPLPPSLVVQTQKSLHCYWLMKSAKVERFRHVQKQLVAQFNGDPVCVNESRVLRLPGFYHCKKEPVMVSVVLFAPERRYTQDELSAALPKVADEPTAVTATAAKGTRKGIAQVGKRCDFMQHCKANAATLGEHDWYAMISNLAVFEDGDKAIHQLSKAYPKYSYGETQRKIAHFLESGTKPMTCARIAEKGFKCPKLENGGCDCKSPAALAFKALSSTELLEILNNLEKQTSALENIQTAKQFIQDYLYNIDAATAETLINYDLKLKFDFKTTDLRPLLQLHREIFKRYSDSKEAKEQKSQHSEHGELPQWYELTDKGALRFLPGALAGHLKANTAAFYSAEQYYLYGGGVYNAVVDLEAKNVVRGHLIEKHATLNNVNDAEGQWRMSIIRPVTDLNANPFIINVRNGLFNVQTGELMPHTSDYFSTVQLNVRYEPNAECPEFMRYLEMSYKPEDIPLIQEMLGYFLVPVTKAQKAFVIVGAPGAGKSLTLLTLNKILLGQKNVSNVMWQSFNERFKTAELFGKYGNIFADLPSKAIDDNGMFKALVGEDFITAERKGKDPFTFQSYARLLFSCNSIPRNYGDKSEGFYRRLIIIPFAGKRVPEDKKDVELLDKFQSEADGIFMFALEGLKRLIGNKFIFTETKNTIAELHKYRVDSNSVLSFVEECCTVDTDAEVERTELFNKYRDYCKDSNLQPVSQKTFNKDLESGVPNVVKAKDRLGKRNTWRGLRYGQDD